MSKEKIHATAIAEQLAGQLSLNKRVAEDFVKALIATIEDSLLAKDAVKLKGLGTFKLQWNVPRKSVDVNTGDEIIIDGYYKVVFTPENELKELVNEPYAHLEPALLSEEGDEVVAVNADDAIDSPIKAVPLQLFNEQANEIKEIISEINALSKHEETAPQMNTDEKKHEHLPVPSEEFQNKISKPSQAKKSKKENRKVLDYFFIGAMIGGLLIYIIIDFNAISFFSNYMQSNQVESSPEYYLPSTTITPLDTIISDTITSDSLPMQIVDSIDVIVSKVENKKESVDKLQSLFDQPRAYKEFIATEEVIPGSRLTRISERHYGAKEFWVYIYEANKDQFTHPDQVAPGTILKIPKLNPVLADKDNPRCIEYALHLHDVYLKQ